MPINKVLKSTQQFLLDIQFKSLRWKKASYITVTSCRIFLLLTLFLRLSVITKISYSYYDITITYSIYVQYSYATVDWILMAVNKKDIEHWKEPAVQMSSGVLPYYPPLHTIQTINKPHISIKLMNSMHPILQPL